MRLFVAKSAGFCFGVRRAMEIALEAARRYRPPLYTLGPLIHNPQAVAHLETFGIEVRDRVEEIEQGTVILRSHGVSSADFQRLKAKRRVRIIDATCPIVKEAHLHAKFLCRNHYALMIIGEPDHPEVEAIQSYLNGEVVVVRNAEELGRLGPWEKLGIIAQTTQSLQRFRDVIGASLSRAKEIRVFNTICHATTLRQREAVEIAKKVDCMIVIGGYNSANTQRLAEICREVQPETYAIETAEEIQAGWLFRKGKIGVTAGASTPSWVIEGVVKALRKFQRKGR